MPPVSVLIKPSSGLCNMQCDYCFYCDEIQKRKQESYGFMSEQTLKNVIRRTMIPAEGAISYIFQGGEPTLRGIDFFEKVIQYEQMYIKHGIYVSNALQTNGYLIDDSWCKFLKKNNFLVGLSVDGIQETHNRYRHVKNEKDSFEKVINAAMLMDQYEIPYNILTVVTRNIVENIDKIYAFYREKGWKYQQYIECLDPLGEEHGKREYALKPKEYGHFLVKLFELWHEDWKMGEQPYIRLFDNYIGILLGHYPEACNQRGICGIQNVVEADGGVYCCDFYMLDEYYLGNFNYNRLEEIDKNRQKIGFIQRSLQLAEECKTCEYFKLCRGGCQRSRDLIPGSRKYKNYFCEGYKIFFDSCIRKMEEIAGMSQKR